ncbi:hypothetical protein FO519_006650 [Halicephalobus sp. NKZ332]|nr:hypothetical protein FO519_006650 [Halicephalobus sp. NKZ332]
MWSGSFFSRSSKAGSSAVQSQVSPFGNTPSIPANVHGASGGVVPPVLLEESRVPKFYKDCLAQCGATSSNQLPNTGLVYNLMVTSELSKDSLSNIWNMVNRSIPGQLTRQEFFSCLALIALAQKGESISALCGVNTLPIPHLQTFTTGGVGKSAQKQQNGNKTFVDTANLQMQTKASQIQGTNRDMDDNILNLKNKNAKFVPTTLVDSEKSRQIEGQNNNGLDDLLGGLTFSATEDTFSTIPEQETKRNSIAFDILDLDLSINENIPQEAAKTSPHEDDPYAILREGPEEDEYLVTWEKVTQEATNIIYQSIDLLRQNPSAAAEVVMMEQGIRFIHAVQAIANMLNRVAISVHKYRPSEKKLMEDAKECLKAWKTFLKENNAVESALRTELETSGTISGHRGTLTCYLCLQQVPNEDPACLEFSSCFYHSSCANFWVNHIDLGLPQLEPFRT